MRTAPGSSHPLGSDYSPTDKIDPHLIGIALVVVLGGFMSILDTTIVNVAIRKLLTAFHASLATAQWISTGYMLALASVIPLTGWAADRFGTKRLYMMSISLFLIGSALAGASWSMPTLILSRVLQGLGGGMIMPAGMIILGHAGGPQRMGRLMGIVGVPMLLGPILGPIFGGWLVDNMSWRWIFFVNLPVGAIALYFAYSVLDHDAPEPHRRLDWPGLLLLSPGLALFVYGLAETTAAGNLQSVANDSFMLGGCAMVVAFMLHAVRSPAAPIDVKLFGRRTVGAAALTTFLFGTAFFGMALVLPLYFMVVRGESAFDTGLLTAVQGFGAMISMPFSSRMLDKTGAGNIVLVGLTLAAVAMLGLALTGGEASLWRIELLLFISGLGMGSTMMPAMSAALGALQRHEVGGATTGLNVVQRAGGSIGMALLAVILTHQMSYLSLARENSDVSLGAVLGAHSIARTDILPALDRAFGHTFLWDFGIILLALCAAMFLPRKAAKLDSDENIVSAVID